MRHPGQLAYIGIFVLLLTGAAHAATRHALLVGVTQYEHLHKVLWLNGPTNDVALMRDLLVTRFDFKPEHVTTLAGWPDAVPSRPTRANIEREFRRLAEVAEPGDQVVILLSGHGSQQPAAEDAHDREPDGFDEIFLPADVKKWNRTVGTVENAIVDDELRDWLRAIRHRGAFVWVIIDSCHSGTMTRGAPQEQERERQVPAGTLIPEEVVKQTNRRATQGEQTRGGAENMPILGLPAPQPQDSPTPGGLVALYAAQPFEVTPELPRPQGNNTRYGLFTYTLVEVLQQSKSTLTYQELAERVAARYRSMGRFQPTPLIEGRDQDREVLGLREWPERPNLLLGKDENGNVRLQAGSLHGLHPGTILAVYPPAGVEGADDPVGHVRVIHVEPLTARVEPAPFEEQPAAPADQLTPGARCQIVFVDYGDFRLKVAVQLQTGADQVDIVAPGNGPPVIEATLNQLAGASDNLIERATGTGEADWYVRMIQDKVVLVPASGLPSKAPGTPLEGFTLGDVADEAKLKQTLQQALTRLARAHNLLHVATETGSGNTRAGGLDVRIEILDAKGKAIAYGTGGREVYGGDRVTVRLTNGSRHPVDATVLLVDSEYGITSLFPYPGEYNRLKTNDTVPLPMEVAEPFGRDQLVVIAVKAAGSVPMDFAYLAQPGLPDTTKRGQTLETTPLGQLLDNAVFNQGVTRGVTRDIIDTYAVRLIGWTSREK